MSADFNAGMNDWLEISLTAADERQAERIESALEAAGAVAVSYEAADEEELYEPPIGEMPLWASTRIVGLFPQNSAPEPIILALQNTLGADFPLDKRLLADREWARAWLEHFRPIRFGKHFWVASTEHTVDDPQATVLRLDPGLAFGTGTHPSTAMCLEALVARDLRGKSVYDYGCGSGILGIAAGLLGAKNVYQTDIDPQALRASAENAAKNGVNITLCPRPETAPPVDLLIANILLEPLCQLRPAFERHITPQTELIFAGILEDQQARIDEVYRDAYTIRRLNQREGWIALSLSPKS